MKEFSGKALFLDRSDINTDEIIPARYLTEISKEALKPYVLEDLALEGFNAAEAVKGKSVIITRANLGCGSSREHAPWALEVNNINVVIAESFARIFRQNMFNCGMLALELDKETIDSLFTTYAGTDCDVSVDIDAGVLTVGDGTQKETIPLELAKFDEALIRAGGWVEFADKNY